jgi:G3E family GTPase
MNNQCFMPIETSTITRTHVITGSFGSGKTTAIRWLMAHKPTEELWIVILNEFTDAGIDALSVAQSARGNYDVRLVAGGCLCCVGELEFGKQLRDILRNFKSNPAVPDTRRTSSIRFRSTSRRRRWN